MELLASRPQRLVRLAEVVAALIERPELLWKVISKRLTVPGGRTLTLDSDETSRLFRTSNFSACSYACLCNTSLSASGIRNEASATGMPLGSLQLSWGNASELGASEQVWLRCLLLDRRTGRPRSITDDSDMFLLWDVAAVAMGSRLSILGEPRRSTALEGEPALKGLEIADRGVGSGRPIFGERLESTALEGEVPLGVVIEAGVISCVLLDLEWSLRGLGDGLRSVSGDFGGTSGGSSIPSRMLFVSTFSAGFAFTPGLRMGDSGFPRALGTSNLLILGVSAVAGGVVCSVGTGEGPVTQDMRASPNGPVLQLVPGALLDLSWPKASVEAFACRGGRPGIVAVYCQPSTCTQLVAELTRINGHLLHCCHSAAELRYTDFAPP